MTIKYIKTVESSSSSPRRYFLKSVWAALGVIAVGELFWVLIGFFKSGSKPAAAVDKSSLINAGSVDQYTPGTVTAFVRGRFYLACLEDGGFLAVSRKCTHLGCTVPWDDEKKQFICPCHASVFDISGNVISPPAPRPLDIHPVTIENRTIMVDAGKTIRRKTFEPSQAAYDPDRNSGAAGRDS
nr:ubiquinol-cytochrome c reductase iron-sulfur subunit [uncultured Desulfobacter sp.]